MQTTDLFSAQAKMKQYIWCIYNLNLLANFNCTGIYIAVKHYLDTMFTDTMLFTDGIQIFMFT